MTQALTATPWTPGPLAAFGEHKSEHGKFVYAVRETEPKGQIAGYPTPTARYRSRGDAQLGALAPEMAHVIEWYDRIATASDEVFDAEVEDNVAAMRALAMKLREIGGTS